MDEFWTMHPIMFNILSDRYHRTVAEGRAFLANAFGCKKEDGSQYTSDDFMPEERKEEESNGWDELCGQMKAMAARRGNLEGA